MSCHGVLAALPAGFTVTTTTDSLSVAWATPGTGDVPATFNVDVSEGTTNKATCTSASGSPCEVSSGLSAGTGYLIKVTDSDTSIEHIDTYYTGWYDQGDTPVTFHVTSFRINKNKQIVLGPDKVTSDMSLW